MRCQVHSDSVQLWLSARDTEEWATRPHAAWPGSTLRGSRLFAEFDRNGLVDLTIDGRRGDCDVTEFNALASDLLADRLAPSHPCYLVVVGQFQRPPAA